MIIYGLVLILSFYFVSSMVLAEESITEATKNTENTEVIEVAQKEQVEVVELAVPVEVVDPSALQLDSWQASSAPEDGQDPQNSDELGGEAEKAEIAKAAFVEKAKEFEVLGVEDFDQFGVALMKMAGVEELAVVSEVLAKAVNIAKNASVFEQQGHDVEAEESSLTGLQKALEARSKKS